MFSLFAEFITEFERLHRNYTAKIICLKLSNIHLAVRQ